MNDILSNLKETRQIVGFIPVRKGSKSIPLKNIKLLLGRPLVFWIIDALIESKCEKVYVYTDSNEIKKKVKQAFSEKSVEIIDRPPETSTDIAQSEIGLLDFCKRIPADIIVFAQATSPLLDAKYIDLGIDAIINGYDSAISVTRQKRFIWEEKDGLAFPTNYDPNKRLMRQEMSGFLVENGAFYISKKEKILESRCRISGKIKLIELPLETYQELDEPSDWVIVEDLLKERLKRYKKFNKIRMFVLDIDGVLTDGGMYYGENGEELKKFNTKDGMGLQILQIMNIKICVITGEHNEINRQRIKKLLIDELYEGITDKFQCLKTILKKYSCNFSEIAYIGDDINDITCMYAAGISFCPSDAEKEALMASDIILSRPGGCGAVREAIEWIIKINERIRRNYSNV